MEVSLQENDAYLSWYHSKSSLSLCLSMKIQPQLVTPRITCLILSKISDLGQKNLFNYYHKIFPKTQ